MSDENDELVDQFFREYKQKQKAKGDALLAHIPEACWSELLSRTKVAARKKDREFNLTHSHLRYLAVRTKGCCDVTGIKFSLATVAGSNRRPFAPSIDRIDCSKGYVIGNVRLVCIAVNVALSDWGDGVLYHIAEALTSKYAKGKPKPPVLALDQECKPNAPKTRSAKWVSEYMERYVAS